LRSEIVALVSARRERGVSLAAVAAELGVSESSLARWTSAEQVVEVEGVLREVQVVRPVSRVAGLTLVTPRGYRVEGLDAEGAMRLLRELWW
jgi:transcriptional regulator with XRE-family HTH domain